MVIDIVRDVVSPFLLVLDELVVQILKLRILFEHSHEVFVALFRFYLVAIFQPQCVSIVNQLRWSAHVPQAQHLSQRILEYEWSVAVVDKLYESTVHHLIVQNLPRQQCKLVGVQFLHILGSKLTSDSIVDGLYKHVDKLVHSLHRCLLQLLVLNNYLCHIFLKILKSKFLTRTLPSAFCASALQAPYPFQESLHDYAESAQ